MILEVFYRNLHRVGRLAEQPGTGRIFFQFDQDWIDGGIDLSPFRLPLSLGPQLVGHHDHFTRQRLHGLFSDSLPQGWGRKLLNRRLRELGFHQGGAGELVLLSHLGDRAMGALSYRPDADSPPRLLEAASLAQVDFEAGRFAEHTDVTSGLEALIAAGTPPDGARPKVLALVQGESVRLDPRVQEGWEPWIIKLSEADHLNAGRIEFAYSQMAVASGLRLPVTRLFDGKYFGARRFDRSGCAKEHVHTFGHLLQTIDASYEDLALAALELTRDMRVLEDVFRRAAFNVGALVRDDHVQNVAFRMSAAGDWSLAPGYDLTPNHLDRIPRGHSMTIRGRERPGAPELLEFAREFGVPNARAMLEQVRGAIDRWPQFAHEASLDETTTAKVQTILVDGQLALRPSFVRRSGNGL